MLKTIDGDTFEADLNRNGRIAGKQERVRLLYVDTPELNESHKGKDLRMDSCQRFFEAKTEYRKMQSLGGSENSRESRTSPGAGRMLGNNINLELIREGHSYFDTRFSRPRNYVLYARQEAQAFNSRRGIWSSLDSRNLPETVKRRGKTVYSLKNPLLRRSQESST